MISEIKRIIPIQIFRFFQPIYHWKLSLLGALLYQFPSRKIFVIGITGTKGKSTTTEILNSILEKAGFKTALSNTIRFKIGEYSEPNLFKMSMPGRFFMQRFLYKAVEARCTCAIIEMTSEGAKQFRHKWIELDAFVFTNLAPEHIESHGSYEKYRDAKLSIAELIETSQKPKTYTVVNTDDPEAFRFLAINAKERLTYSISNAEPYSLHEDGLEFTYRGQKIKTKLTGLFNIYNCLAAATLASALNISVEIIKSAIEEISEIRGRVERINVGQDFDVIVDYAHTPDSLKKLYEAFPNQRKICVLGNTGGGRDTWKRPEMGKIADNFCDYIILTNEDPYDEDPWQIVDQMKSAIVKKPNEIIIDRHKAIAKAISLARTRDVVLISGKGTDPYIMGPNGSKISWSDRDVVREELIKVVKK